MWRYHTATTVIGIAKLVYMRKLQGARAPVPHSLWRQCIKGLRSICHAFEGLDVAAYRTFSLEHCNNSGTSMLFMTSPMTQRLYHTEPQQRLQVHVSVTCCNLHCRHKTGALASKQIFALTLGSAARSMCRTVTISNQTSECHCWSIGK